MSRENNRDEKGSGRRDRASGDKKKDSYKAKRSFTRNKTIRSKQNEEGRGAKRGFSSTGDKPWKSSSDRDRRRSGDAPRRDDKETAKKPRAPRETKEDREFKYQKRVDESRFDEKRDGKREGPEKSRRGEAGEAWKRSGRPDDRSERAPSRGGNDRKFGGSERDRNERSGDREKRSSYTDGGEKRRKFKPRDDERRPSKAREERGFDGKREKRGEGNEEGRRVKHADFEEGKAFSKQERKEKPSKAVSKNADGLIRLNKYLSNAGIASRREADNLILSGTVKVNGVVADQLGTKIKPTDKVTYGDSAVKSERKVYLLLNKPKDYITTVDDPRERKTVMELISGACRERVYPVGRLDRNTTGLLLFTNDGELTTKLTHPKFGIKKVYHVSLNKGLKPEHFKEIIEGIELEDGQIKADDLAFVGEGKKEVGIEVHSGRNRIVRRIFEHLGYDVLKLDRVVFAGLTKKDLPRGKYRFLTAKEISFLQMIG